MGIFFQYKRPEIRQFNYVPRFYDAQKEAMDERRERIRKEIETDEKRRTTHTLERGFLNRDRQVKTAISGSTLMMAAIISVMVATAYYIFN